MQTFKTSLLLIGLSIFISPVTTTLIAQDTASIVKFNLECTVSVDYDIWDDDYSSDFIYVNESKEKKTIRTVDTIFSYAQEAIAHKLGVAMDKKTVGKESKQNMVGKITGFPNEKVKAVAAIGKYNRLIEVSAIAVRGPGTVSEKGATTKRKYQIDMIVEVKVYDKEGSEIEKYKKRSRLDDIKQTVEVYGVRDTNDLSGNELFALFAYALDNTLKNKN